MLKKTMERNLNLNKEIFELYYKYTNKQNIIEIIVECRRLFIVIIFLILSFICRNNIKIYAIFISATFFIMAIEFIERINQIRNQGLKTKFQLRSSKIKHFLEKELITKKGKVITRKDWKSIKKHDKSLYKDATTDESYGECYYFSIELAKFLNNAKVIYCIQYDPIYKNGIAHAVISKDGEIYDTNLRQHFKYEDYVKLHKLKIYKVYDYNDYSKDDFHLSIKSGFVEFCNSNNVKACSS